MPTTSTATTTSTRCLSSELDNTIAWLPTARCGALRALCRQQHGRRQSTPPSLPTWTVTAIRISWAPSNMPTRSSGTRTGWLHAHLHRAPDQPVRRRGARCLRSRSGHRRRHRCPCPRRAGTVKSPGNENRGGQLWHCAELPGGGWATAVPQRRCSPAAAQRRS